jgi:hypothetical protein
MERTWMPKVAGIISILAGVINLFTTFLLLISAFAVQGMAAFLAIPLWLPINASVALLFVGFPFLTCGVLSLIGGVYALQRKNWGLALVGAIMSFFPYCILGLVAVVLIAISKDEFKSNYQPLSVTVSQGV